MRIFYGVAGEGMGHATRSRAVLDELAKNHEVFVFCGDKAFDYLSGRFSNVHRITSLRIVYKNNSVCTIRTGIHNLLRIKNHFRSLWKINSLIREKKPDLIINDFTHQLSYLGWLHGIRHVSIDNVHAVTDTDAYARGKWNRLKSALVIRLTVPYSSARIIPSFFPCRPRNRNTRIVNPIIRKEVMVLSPVKGSHIFVYQTSPSNKKIIPVLKQAGVPCIIYGFGKKNKENNLHFKQFNEKEFFADLASARAVIANGGFTLISEALYLGKPVLAIPIKKQYEQVLNAHNLQKYGLGVCAEELDSKMLMLLLEQDGKRVEAEDVQKIVRICTGIW